MGSERYRIHRGALVREKRLLFRTGGCCFVRVLWNSGGCEVLSFYRREICRPKGGGRGERGLVGSLDNTLVTQSWP